MQNLLGRSVLQLHWDPASPCAPGPRSLSRPSCRAARLNLSHHRPGFLPCIFRIMCVFAELPFLILLPILSFGFHLPFNVILNVSVGDASLFLPKTFLCSLK